MQKIELSDRLHQAASFVIEKEPILDVGSDHAYLPIYLVQNEIVPQAIAGEVVEGPFHHAEQTVARFDLEDKVSVRFGDGLNVLHEQEEIGTIFVCGMGGVLISDILDSGIENKKMPQNARLVLQPNNAENRLREFLMNARYRIVEESILEENDKIYEIIVAEYSNQEVQYSELELFFGPKLLEERSPIFVQKWKEELLKNQHIYAQIKETKNEEKMREFERIIEKIEKVIQ